MIIFDSGDGVRRQYKQRLQQLEQERMVRQLRRLQQPPGVIAGWWASLGTALIAWRVRPGAGAARVECSSEK